MNIIPCDGHCHYDTNMTCYKYYRGSPKLLTMKQLHMEALSTTTSSLDIGIIEDEFIFQFCLYVVHFCTEETQLGLCINENTSTWRVGQNPGKLGALVPVVSRHRNLPSWRTSSSNFPFSPAYWSVYESPLQPLVLTPTRRPTCGKMNRHGSKIPEGDITQSPRNSVLHHK